jgi:hypothetical protein
VDDVWMNTKKSFFLFLALLLPIFIFLFLKYFGRNEFTVDPLFQEPVQVPPACEGIHYSVPYIVTDSIFITLGLRGSISVIVFRASNQEAKQEQGIQVSRVLKEFDGDPLQVVLLRDSIIGENDEQMNSVKLGEAELRKMKECIFLMTSQTDVVVLDTNRRIMGHYVSTDREDIDRLILELKIQLKKY